MSKIEEVAGLVENGKRKLVPAAVQEALDEGNAPIDVLNAMIGAMDVVGDKFKRNEIFVPEMLIAAKAMKAGVEVLKPLLAAEGGTNLGTVIIGTVAGDNCMFACLREGVTGELFMEHLRKIIPDLED